MPRPRKERPESPDDIGQRIRIAREGMGWTREHFAHRLRVHPGSIARWETGGSTPQPFHLARIAELCGTTPAWLRYGQGSGPAIRRGADVEETDVFGSREHIARFIVRLGPRGEERARKQDALNAYRQLITTREPLPGWWYELMEKVDAGEI